MQWRSLDEIEDNLLILFFENWPRRHDPRIRKYVRRHIEGLRTVKQEKARREAERLELES